MDTDVGIQANVRQVIPFFFVHDMERSRAFYVDQLGFTTEHSWIDGGKLRWCQLALGSAALMLQEFWTEGHHRNVPDVPVGVGVSLNFICQDAIALYQTFVSRGVAATPPIVGNGMWVTQLTDPDGYALCFESLTDSPEGTTSTEPQ